MAQTYDEIQQQIQRLQQKAEALRSSEVKEVVEKIKVANRLGAGGIRTGQSLRVPAG